MARGWATVELERAAAALTGLLTPGAVFEEASRSAILGARCLRSRARGAAASDGVVDDADWIVLLEPDTEGRLAGHLARFGEGWAVTWTVGDGDGDRRRHGFTPGPLGEERLAEGRDIGGPFRLLLPAATIDP